MSKTIKTREQLIDRFLVIEKLLPTPDEISVLIETEPPMLIKKESMKEENISSGELYDKIAQRVQIAMLSISVARLECTIQRRVEIEPENTISADYGKLPIP